MKIYLKIKLHVKFLKSNYLKYIYTNLVYNKI